VGFSLVAACAIIGVALLISLEIITGSLLPTITDIQDSLDDVVDRSVERIQTNINITSVSVYINGSNYDHNVTIKNVGSVTLSTTNFLILINGTAQGFRCPDVYLYPEKETNFNIRNLPGSGNKRLKVITNNGISDYYEYIIII
jgi:archaellum component FlaF (FlaF/FlaG flagellin family)